MKKILKKIKIAFTNPRLILVRLMQKGYIKVNDKVFIKIMWKCFFDYPLNIQDPKTFNEKLQWLKLYNRDEKLTDLVDKYKVKEIVGNIIGDEYIVPNIQVCNEFSEINFDKLPNQFVIKCNHDSGGLYICRDKKKFDKEKARKIINKSLKRNFYNYSREWQYKNVSKKIIVEKYLEDKKNKELNNYKFFCFHGSPKYLSISAGLENHSTATVDFFDMNFEPAPFGRIDYKRFSVKPKKPEKLDEMIKIAKELSKDFVFVRVDLYEVNNKIYFGELTFTPCAGFIKFDPSEWDLKLGSMIDLTGIKNEK